VQALAQIPEKGLSESSCTLYKVKQMCRKAVQMNFETVLKINLKSINSVSYHITFDILYVY
jgi:hypothetical protein